MSHMIQVAKPSIFLFLLLFYSYTPSTQKYIYDIDCPDGTIHFEIYGTGTPVLIINGGPGMNSIGFRHLASTIGKSNRAIIYDQRGTGQSVISPIDSSSLTLDLMIEDIERIRKHLGLENWVVLGHSFGGMLGSYYATQHPDRISGMILSSSGGIDLDLFSYFNITSRLTQLQRDSMDYWGAQMDAGDTSYHTKYQFGRNLAPAYLYNKSYVDVVAHRLTQGNMNVNALVFQDMRKNKFNCAEGLASFTAPVLIIQGKEDVIHEDLSMKAHNVLPNSQLVILDECSHYGWLDQPDEYFGHITNFMKRIQ